MQALKTKQMALGNRQTISNSRLGMLFLACFPCEPEGVRRALAQDRILRTCHLLRMLRASGAVGQRWHGVGKVAVLGRR